MGFEYEEVEVEVKRTTSLAEKVSNVVREELLIARGYLELILQNPAKYLVYTFRHYFLDVFRIASGLKAGYLAFRKADDIADGEADLPAEFDSFADFIDAAKHQIRTGVIDVRSDVLFLLNSAFAKISKQEKTEGETQNAFEGFLDAMLAEFERRTQSLLLTQEELRQVHTASAYHAHNIALISLRSKNRAEDTPELSEFIARTDALRDLEKDLRLGIVNVPGGVIAQSGLSYRHVAQYPETIYANRHILSWMQSELENLRELRDKLTSYEHLDKYAKKILQSRIRQRRKFIDIHLPQMIDSFLFREASI